MTDNPSTPPSEERPTEELPIDPPTLLLVDASDDIAVATQAVYDQVVDLLAEAARCYGECAAALRQRIQTYLDIAEGDYTSVGDALAGHIGALVGYAYLTAHEAGVQGITPEEIRQRVAAIPFPGRGLPPAPTPPQPLMPGPTPSVRRVPIAGSAITLPQFPGTPTWLRPVTTPLPPMGAPGTTGPAAPPGPAGQPPAAPPPAGRPPGAAQLPGAPARVTGTVPFEGYIPTVQTYTVGADPAGMTPPIAVTTPLQPMPFGPPPATGDGIPVPAAGTTAAHVGGATVGHSGTEQVCPPVVVNIRCEGGATAQLVTADASASNGQTGPAGPPGTGASDTDKQLGFRLRGGFLEEAEGPIAVWAKRTFGQPIDKEGQPRTVELVDTAGWAELQRAFRAVNESDECASGEDVVKSARDVTRLFWQWATGTDDGSTIKEGSAAYDLLAGLPDFARAFVAAPVFGGVQLLRGALQAAGAASGCDPSAYSVLSIGRGVLDVVQTWVGVQFPEAHARLDQLAGRVCAAMMPGVEEADLSRLMGEIDHDTWKCWVRSAGVRDDLHQTVLKAKSVRPNADQTVAFALRQNLTAEATDQLLSRTGVSELIDRAAFKRLAEYVPGPSDLVQFMTRDVFDPAVVELYGYDKEFTEKFKGKAEEWARSQGMTSDQFLYYWRAHWHLPSPTQGFEMIHRLRPGRVKDDVVTTKEDVNRLLAINDYPAYWRDRLIELSYNPLTRVDTRRAFFIGALSEAETKEAIKDLGYNDREAGLLLRYWELERVEWLLNRPWARAYARGELTDVEVREEIDRLNLPANVQDRFEGLLEIRMKTGLRKETIKAIKARVTRGITDWADAVTELTALGYAGARAALMARAWDDTRQARGKFVAAGALCKWHDRGLIKTDEYADALSRQGYLPEDVGRIIETCRVDAAESAAKKSVAAGKTAAREKTAEERAEQLRKRRLTMTAARAKREAANLSRAEERVQKRLTHVTTFIATRLGGISGAHRDGVMRVFGVLHGEKGYSRQGAADLLAEVIEGMVRRGRTDWADAALAYAESLPVLSLFDPLGEPIERAELLPPPEVNGS